MRKHIANSPENRTYRYTYFTDRFVETYDAWLDAPADTAPRSALDLELDRLTHILDGISLPESRTESIWARHND